MINWEYEIRKRKEKLWLWFVFRLPKRLCYWVGIRLMAKATTGEYSTTIVSELTMMEAIKRNE